MPLTNKIAEGVIVYNQLESNVLSKFFTNLDSNVYAATDSMPTSLWAFLEGGYSRSNLSMRDRFLAIFKEMTKTEEDYNALLSDLVGDPNSSEIYGVVLAKAENFMRKWAVDYGHNSLKDSAVDRIAIENVSIRATKILENSSLGAFQEKSTRYMDFSEDNFYIPESEHVTDKELQILTDSMKLYRKVLAFGIEHFKGKISRDDFKTEAAWIRTCNAKAFDEARYLLPTSVKTSLGVTLPTRETERWLSELFASPEQEIKDLAVKIKDECIKINPGLLKHVEANEFSVTRNHPIALGLRERANQGKADSLIGQELQVAPFDGETISGMMVTAFIGACGIFDPSNLEFEDVMQSLDQYLNSRGPHDEFPKWMAFGDHMFRFCIDIGAYRDVQRHRIGVQIPSDWCPSYGYSIPDLLHEETATELKTEYVELCERIKNVIGNLYKNDRFVAGYFLILGTNINVIYSCDFRQLAYFIELRSGQAGHYSYRRLAQAFYKLIEQEYPLFAKYIRVDMSGYEDRREAEERIQEKIKKAQDN